MAAADVEKVRELVFSGGTALAGLILVFLGAVFTSFDSYDADQRDAISAKYRHRAIIAVVGFAAALLAAIFALAGYWAFSCLLFYGSIASLAASFLMVLWVACLAVADIR